MSINLKIAVRDDLKPEALENTFRPSPCVLVYYDGSLASMAALRAACEEFQAGTRIVAVYLDMVPLVPESRAQSEKRLFDAKAVLAAAAVNAATYGFPVETLCLEAHTRGQAFVQLAADCGDSTIYIGNDPEHSDWLVDYVQAHAPANAVVVLV